MNEGGISPLIYALSELPGSRYYISRFAMTTYVGLLICWNIRAPTHMLSWRICVLIVGSFLLDVRSIRTCTRTPAHSPIPVNVLKRPSQTPR